MNGTSFFICSKLAISVLFAAPKVSAWLAALRCQKEFRNKRWRKGCVQVATSSDEYVFLSHVVKFLWTEHLHTRIFSQMYTLILAHMHLHGSRCCGTCLIVRCLSTHWSLPLFRVSLHLVQSLHLLYSVHPPRGRNRRVQEPLRTRRMRSMALWRYKTLLQVMSPNSSTTSTTQRLQQRSSRMNPST